MRIYYYRHKSLHESSVGTPEICVAGLTKHDQMRMPRVRWTIVANHILLFKYYYSSWANSFLIFYSGSRRKDKRRQIDYSVEKVNCSVFVSRSVSNYFDRLSSHFICLASLSDVHTIIIIIIIIRVYNTRARGYTPHTRALTLTERLNNNNNYYYEQQ